MKVLKRPSRRWLAAGVVAGVLFAGSAWTTGEPVATRDPGAGSGLEEAFGADDADDPSSSNEPGGWDLADLRVSDIHGRPHDTFNVALPEGRFDDADPWVPTWRNGPSGVGAFNFQGGERDVVDAASHPVTAASIDAGAAFPVGATAEVPRLGPASGVAPFAGGQSGTGTPVARGVPATAATAAETGARVRETTERRFDPFDAHILAGLGPASDGGAAVLSALDAQQDPGASQGGGLQGGSLQGGASAPLDLEAILVAGFAQGPAAQAAPDGAGHLPVALVVPEPASWALVGLGLGLCGLLRNRRLRRRGRAA